MQPSLAESWTLENDGRTLEVKVRPNVKFHDGTPLTANEVASILPNSLKTFMGPVFSDVEHIRASGSDSVEIAFRGASPFLRESLETAIQKPGATVVGTGLFAVVPDSKTEMRGNSDYYLGAPVIGAIQVATYPSIRSAWADMLRDRLDMLLEVGSDALASMEKSNATSVFTFTRRYQYVIALNHRKPVMQPAEIRRALNQAIDRESVVRNGLDSYGVASSGPIWLRYWALPQSLPAFKFDPRAAAATLAGAAGRGTKPRQRLRFTCLVPPDAVSERIALEVKRQLESVGVEMILEEQTQDGIVQRTTAHDYEAALIEFISGPTLFRPYLIWHSTGPLNWGGFGNEAVDRVLDRVRHAGSEAEYRQAVAGVQQAFLGDPPAIFLAWSVRARAVSNRFVVPPAEPGRDVLSTLRLWKPATGDLRASRN